MAVESPTTQTATRSGRDRRRRRLAIGLSSGLALLLALIALCPTPIVEQLANARGSELLRCASVRQLHIQLASWPVIGRVLTGSGVHASGSLASLTTQNFSIHNVTFTATVNGINRTTLIGAHADPHIQLLTAHATLTTADLNQTIRDHTQLPISITPGPHGHYQLTYSGGLVAVSVPLRIALNDGDVEVSAAVPILGLVRLQIPPPNPIVLTAMSETATGIQLAAHLQTSANTSELLCGLGA